MAFGARIEDGKWRLCYRKGDTITFVQRRGHNFEMVFRSQKKAKACADQLNEKYWKQFSEAKKKRTSLDSTTEDEMIDVILNHMM